MIYKLLFKLYLWTHVPGMSLLAALRYPVYPEDGCGDVFEDARCEMSYMEL